MPLRLVTILYNLKKIYRLLQFTDIPVNIHVLRLVIYRKRLLKCIVMNTYNYTQNHSSAIALVILTLRNAISSTVISIILIKLCYQTYMVITRLILKIV